MIKKENIVLFVDSLSALQSLENFNTNTRPDLIFEIFQLIYQLYKKENHITFCWIPSHCNIAGNEQVDKAAKRGAEQKSKFINLPISHSIDEYSNILPHTFKSNFFDNNKLSYFLKKYTEFCKLQLKNQTIQHYRHIISLSIKLKTNSFKTKYCKSITCKCGVHLSRKHVIKYCTLTNHLFPKNLRTKINQIENIEILLEEFSNLFICAETLMISPIKALL